MNPQNYNTNPLQRPSTIQSLQTQLNHKNLQNKQLLEVITRQNCQIQQLNQKVRQIQTVSREIKKASNQKNIRIAGLEAEVARGGFDGKTNEKIAILEQIIQEQSQELDLYLSDSNTYLSELESYQTTLTQKTNENTLLSQFNQELLKQVEQLEETNLTFEKWVTDYDQELSSQNLQGNDMICQVQYMVDLLEGAA